MSIKLYHKAHRGFTLIELLVVISIIGLLSTLAIVALNSARSKSRDAKRVADIKQVQTAMELFFDKNNTYKPTGCAGTVPALVSTCTGTSATGLADFLGGIANLNDPSSASACTHTSTGASTTTCNYAFTGAAPDTSTYKIAFTLEVGSGSLGAGQHLLTQTGVQ